MSKFEPEFDKELPPIVFDTSVPAVGSLGLRIAGSLVKGLAVPFHALRPGWRRVVPEVFPAAQPSAQGKGDGEIPLVVWQTNFTDRCSWPMWMNVAHNRRLAPEFEFRFVGQEAMERQMAKAPPKVGKAFSRLASGAAQADLWRLQTLYDFGGVYIDMDGTLVTPLARLLRGRRELLVADSLRFTQYFIASAPKNPLFLEFIDAVVDGIEHWEENGRKPVFWTTGPAALEPVLFRHPEIHFARRGDVCRQGVFTNERFQYIDRPRGKWTHDKEFVRPAKREGRVFAAADA